MVLRIESDSERTLPLTSVAGPAFRVTATSALVNRSTRGQDRDVVAGVARGRRHVTDAAVLVLVVVPVDKPRDPRVCLCDGGEAGARVLRAVLECPKQRLREGVVVGNAGAAERRDDTQALQRREHGR